MLDFLLGRNERAQKVLYFITLFAVWFLFTIRYYYGPDIATYVPLYENLHPWHWYLSHPDGYEYEHGFILFCAILKGLGLSYYWMTVAITTIYFAAIALLFRRVRLHRTLLLMTVVFLCYDLIFAQHRQCLSVAFFILMVLCMDEKKYFWAIVCAWLTIEMHKSGIFVVSLTWLFFLVHQQKLSNRFFLVIFALLCLMLALPVSAISTSVISALPLPKSLIVSLNEHFALGRQFQARWIEYAAIVLLIEYYLQHQTEMGRGIEASVIMGLIVLTLSYHYFYFSGRIRSFFMPILFVYMFKIIEDAEEDPVFRESRIAIVKNVSIALFIAFFCYRAFYFEIGIKELKHQLHTPGGKTIYSPCTVFDLRNHSAKYLRSERLKIAECYWYYDFQSAQTKYKVK